MRGMEPSLANAAEAGMWIVEQGDCAGIFHAMAEEDLRRILRHPATMIASDGGIPVFGKASPHPRNYGTFARVLAVYVRELNTITSRMPSARCRRFRPSVSDSPTVVCSGRDEGGCRRLRSGTGP